MIYTLQIISILWFHFTTILFYPSIQLAKFFHFFIAFFRLHTLFTTPPLFSDFLTFFFIFRHFLFLLFFRKYFLNIQKNTQHIHVGYFCIYHYASTILHSAISIPPCPKKKESFTISASATLPNITSTVLHSLSSPVRLTVCTKSSFLKIDIGI